VATSESALLHALDELAGRGYTPDVLVFLQCTSPLTAPEDIDGTIAALDEQGADTAVAVTDFHYFVWKREAEGAAVGVNHDKAFRPRRQDREDQFLETGAVYVMKVPGFQEAKHRFFGKTALYEMPADRVLEIDEPVDLKVAEMLLRERYRTEARRQLPSPVQGLAMDFDGVFTDNRVYVDQNGTETVACRNIAGASARYRRPTSSKRSSRRGRSGSRCAASRSSASDRSSGPSGESSAMTRRSGVSTRTMMA
jgi:N-acylneuraminate cytidylyltransferase